MTYTNTHARTQTHAGKILQLVYYWIFMNVIFRVVQANWGFYKENFMHIFLQIWGRIEVYYVLLHMSFYILNRYGSYIFKYGSIILYVYISVSTTENISAHAKDSTLFNAQVEKNINFNSFFSTVTTWVVEGSLIKLSQDVLRESRINPDKNK